MSEHTKGPWRKRLFTVDADGITITQSGYRGGASQRALEQFDAMREANARLIAVSPCMFELLQRIRQWDQLDTAGDGAYWKQQIDAVIENVSGRKGD